MQFPILIEPLNTVILKGWSYVKGKLKLGYVARKLVMGVKLQFPGPGLAIVVLGELTEEKNRNRTVKVMLFYTWKEIAISWT